jgi:hypothetical protein
MVFIPFEYLTRKLVFTGVYEVLLEGTGWMAKIMNRFGKYNLQ